MTYVADAVAAYVTWLGDVGLLASRPIRLDGLTKGEIGELLPVLTTMTSPGRVRVLGGVNNEAQGLVNAERATRYRNEVDAGANRAGFLLVVPQGQIVESSLDEPAFYVVPRAAIFRHALADARSRLQLSGSDVEGIRETALFRQAEAIYAFLASWDPVTGTVDPEASFRHLGLLKDSALAGDMSAIKARLRRNAGAMELLLRPGQSPRRVLEELANAVGLDLAAGAPAVMALLEWLRAGRQGAAPAAVDFATWPIEALSNPEIRWEPDLAQSPHRGWIDADGRVQVESAQGRATVEWIPVRLTPETKFELELVEDTSQQVVKRLGSTRRSRKSFGWPTIFRADELREELQELNPSGDVEGYALRIRLKMVEGRRWVQEFESKEFFIELPNRGEEVIPGAAPSSYHALYRFHASGRAADPVIQPHDGEPEWSTVRLQSGDGRPKDASLDISRQMADIESWILERPSETGPWRWAPGGGTDASAVLDGTAESDLGPGASTFIEARRVFFELARRRPLEALDLRQPELQSAARAYVNEYGRTVKAMADFAQANGALAEADRLRCAGLASCDAIEVVLPATETEPSYSVLLIAPTHPAVVGWLLSLQELLWRWSRGRFDPALKPPYQGLVEDLHAGPRSMITATNSDGQLRWWGFAGNLSGTWQCFVPIEAGARVRWRDWERDLVQTLALPPRAIGSGRLDARRIGNRLKKYAVLHPYTNQLKIAAIVAGDGRELLDALKVVDEKSNTPAGAQSVREIRYELTLIGPASDNLGRSIEELTLSPGDDKWRRYASVILDNPETVLSPGFAYARRPVRSRSGNGASIWDGLSDELEKVDQEGGVHVLVIGPMLSTSLGAAPVDGLGGSLESNGVISRPLVRHVAATGGSPFEGNWVLVVAASRANAHHPAEQTAADLATALNLAHGLIGGRQQVGLQVALAGNVSDNLRRAHDVSDWVIIADPLFAIDLMDRRRPTETGALVLDFSPEFEPYPGGRVVVTTNALQEVEAIAAAVGRPLAMSREITSVLASVSARLLLGLANPTKQVVGGLTGLALTRVYLREQRPGALVLPIDGHEDMFVIPRRGRGGELADLLVVTLENGKLAFEVVESKWVGRANLDAKIEEGSHQARTSAEVLRSEYLEYGGVDRGVRLENLRDVVSFHIERSIRHDVPASFDASPVRNAFADEATVRGASVAASVVVWCPDSRVGSSETPDRDGVRVLLQDQDAIDEYADKLGQWPNLMRTRPTGAGFPPPGDLETRQVIENVADETLEDDLGARREQELNETEHGLEEPLPQETGAPPSAGEEAPPSAEPVVASVSLQAALEPARAGLEAGCVRLGTILGTARAAEWCPPNLSNGHLILIGGSGAGKTTALRHIAAQIRRSGVPVLVLDFHGDLQPAGPIERLFAFDYEGNAAFVNPFHLDPRYGAKLTPSRLKWEFVEAWRSHYSSMGIHQINYVAELVEEAFTAVGVTDDPATWTRDVTFGDVIDRFEASEAPENLKAKVRSYMKRFREWRIFHGGDGISIESLLEESTRLDLSQLDEIARNILADVVLRRLFLLVRALGPVDPSLSGWTKFRAYVVIDEAQLLMGGTADAKASLTKYAGEARKFGIGLILATQLRDNVPPEIWGNIDTRLFMQALDPGERSRNARAANVAEFVLQSLARGQAILTSSSQPNQRPLTIQIEPEWLRGH